MDEEQRQLAHEKAVAELSGDPVAGPGIEVE